MKFDRIGFIGGGKMALALAKGILANKIVRGDQIMVADPLQPALNSFSEEIKGAVIASNNLQVADKCDLIFIAVKPQMLDEALHGMNQAISAKQMWVSVVAGVTIDQLINKLGTKRVARVMPNTPCLIGAGAFGIAGGPQLLPEDISHLKTICDGIGRSVEVRESWMDAVTGLSGSGPAYVFTFIEALVDGGVLHGLPADVATELAVQTVLGAAKLIQETGDSPAALKAMVTSPGGTTIAGLKALEDAGFRAAVMNAVDAAAKRSAELGRSE